MTSNSLKPNVVPPQEKIAIGLPRGSDTGFIYEFMESLFLTFGYSPCQYKLLSEAKVHHIARNTIIENFLKSDMNYLLFIDSDTIWEPDSLTRLYELVQNKNVDIATGIYFGKGRPYFPVIRKLDLKDACYNIYTDWGNEPFEVDGAGMGFMLIPRYVLEAMKQPYTDWTGGFSEDLNFCLKAKKDHGFKIWADPLIKLGHVGRKVFTSADWAEQYKPGIEALIRETMIGTKHTLDRWYPDRRKELGIHPLDFKNPNTQEHWDKVYTSEGTKENWRTYPEKIEKIVSMISEEFLKGKFKVLEIGCGLPIFAKKLREKMPEAQYKGIDISEVAVTAMNNAGFLAEKREVPPLKEDKQDLVVGLEILEHLDDDKRLELIKEVAGIVGSDGLAMFSVPDNCMPPEQVTEHRTMFDEDSLEKFLRKAFKGVEITKVESRPSHLQGFSKKVSYLVAKCHNIK